MTETAIDNLPAFSGNGDMRENILSLENTIALVEQAEMPVNNYFADGVYVRELFIPKGTVLTGRIHKTKHVNLLMAGDMSVATEKGVKRIQAPYIFIANPGTKKAGYAHEDSIWVNVHPTDSKILDDIEKEFTTATHEEFLEYVEKELLEVT